MRPKSPVYYQVSQSQSVTEQFIELFVRAEQLGLRKVFLEATGYIMDELAYEPLRFGESRGILQHLELEMRIAFAPPIYVEFAVHEKTRQVFFRHFGMRDEKD